MPSPVIESPLTTKKKSPFFTGNNDSKPSTHSSQFWIALRSGSAVMQPKTGMRSGSSSRPCAVNPNRRGRPRPPPSTAMRPRSISGSSARRTGFVRYLQRLHHLRDVRFVTVLFGLSHKFQKLTLTRIQRGKTQGEIQHSPEVPRTDTQNA